MLTTALACLAGTAVAGDLGIELARVDAGQVQAHSVQATLHWPSDADEGRLRIRAARVDVPALEHRLQDLDWSCPLRREGDAWRCAGPLAVGGGAPLALALSLASGSTDVALSNGSARIALATDIARPAQASIRLEQVPLAWLQALASALEGDVRLQDGLLGGQLVVAWPEDAPLRVAGDVRAEAISLDTPDGRIATADLAVAGRVDYRLGPDGHRARVEARYENGEVLVGSVYLGTPAAPITLGGEWHLAPDGAIALSSLVWEDPGVLALRGEARIDASGGLQALRLGAVSPDLGAAGSRYLEGWLGLVGLPGLALGGRVEAHLGMDAEGIARVEAELSEVMLLDPTGRFTLAGLQGRVDWSAHGARPSTRLGWSAAAVYGIGLGAASLPLRSVEGELALVEPAAMDVLGGRLELSHLDFIPPRAGQGVRVGFGVDLDALDLADLSQRLGWPPFTGRVDGRLPSARYADNRLDFDGDIRMALFDGQIRIAGLAMERPFGVAPTLSADVTFSGLDLQPMTAAFGFGEITGRLQGAILGLRLLDWTPVAFDAELRSDPSHRGRRRISQRAVEDISSLGGSGLVAGIQARLLRAFSSFGYRELGISCRLRDEVCRMDGIDSAGQGYILVAGAGIPRIDVVGFRRQVDWPVLVERLKAATEGQRPIFD